MPDLPTGQENRMRGNCVRIRDVPQWAVCYLVYADDYGLNPEDVEMVDNWVQGLAAEGFEQLLGPIDGSENEFCSSPAFGLACNTVDFVAVKSKEKK